MTHDEFMALMLSAFPQASWDVDNDGQILVYTNLQFLTSRDNPSIPEGEHVIQPFPDIP